MNLKNIMYKINLLIYLILIVYFGIFLVKDSSTSIISVKNAGMICVNTLIPSLFPFIFFSSFMINSGIFYLIGKILFPLSHLFFLPKEAISVVILSMIGGFPVGSKGIKDLFDKKIISNEQADRMMMFCVNAGPSFILGVIGTSLIGNMNESMIILIAQVLSSTIIGILLGVYSRNKYKDIYSNNLADDKIIIGEALISSCESSCMSTLNICTLVIIFNMFFSLLEKINVLSFFNNINLNYLPLITLEVTNACISISNLENNLILFSLATSWGGMCVHAQVFSIIKGIKVKYCKFLLFRILNAFLSSLITFVILKFKNIQLSKNVEILKSSNIWGSIFLVAFCIYFLIDLNFSKKTK